MDDKITYGREEGGFSVWVNGKKQGVFRIKGWMNGLHDYPGISTSGGQRPSNKFYQTQYEYHGKYE